MDESDDFFDFNKFIVPNYAAGEKSKIEKPKPRDAILKTEEHLAMSNITCEGLDCTEVARRVFRLGVNELYLCVRDYDFYSTLTPPHADLVKLEQHQREVVRRAWTWVLPYQTTDEDRRTLEAIRRGPEMLATKTPVELQDNDDHNESEVSDSSE